MATKTVIFRSFCDATYIREAQINVSDDPNILIFVRRVLDELSYAYWGSNKTIFFGSGDPLAERLRSQIDASFTSLKLGIPKAIVMVIVEYMTNISLNNIQLWTAGHNLLDLSPKCKWYTKKVRNNIIANIKGTTNNNNNGFDYNNPDDIKLALEKIHMSDLNNNLWNFYGKHMYFMNSFPQACFLLGSGLDKSLFQESGSYVVPSNIRIMHEINLMINERGKYHYNNSKYWGKTIGKEIVFDLHLLDYIIDNEPDLSCCYKWKIYGRFSGFKENVNDVQFCINWGVRYPHTSPIITIYCDTEKEETIDWTKYNFQWNATMHIVQALQFVLVKIVAK